MSTAICFFRSMEKTACIMLLIAAIISMLPGCKTTKVVDYEYDGKTYTERVYVHDTAFVEVERWRTVRDTFVTVLRDTVRIDFVPGGGRVNILTGEVEGVAGISRTSATSSSCAHVEEQKNDSAAISATEVNNVLTETNEAVREREDNRIGGFPWWLLFVGIGIGLALVSALKKLPVTKNLMKWL